MKFDDFLKEQLQDEEFRKEYEALQPERAVIQAIIDARQNALALLRETSANWKTAMRIHLFALCNVLLKVWA